jgi:hypothetical protein
LDRTRRTNPSFLSIDEAARDRKRIEQMVKGISEGKSEGSVVFSNVGYNGPKGLIGSRRLSGYGYHEKAVVTNVELKPTTYSKPRQKTFFPQKNLDRVKYVKLLGETKNFVVQLNYETRLIELYAKDFFIGKLFKLLISAGESKDLTYLLAQARNRIEQKQKVRIGETTHFIVDLDGTHKLVILYEKSNQDVRLGFSEGEVTPILDFLAKARSLF